MSLSEKKCVSCEGGTPPLKPGEVERYLTELGEVWSNIDNTRIIKTFIFSNFADAVEFVNKVAQIAETEGHHPNIYLHSYKKVDIELTTHEIEGLSENDFIVAAKIDGIE